MLLAEGLMPHKAAACSDNAYDRTSVCMGAFGSADDVL